MRKALCVVLSALTVLQPLEGIAQDRTPGITGLGFDPKLDAAIDYVASHDYSPEARDIAQRGYLLDMVYGSYPLGRQGEINALVDLFASRAGEAAHIMNRDLIEKKRWNDKEFRRMIPVQSDVALFREILTNHPESAHELLKSLRDSVLVGAATGKATSFASALPKAIDFLENKDKAAALKEKAVMLLGPSEGNEFSWVTNKLKVKGGTIGIEVAERTKRDYFASNWVKDDHRANDVCGGLGPDAPLPKLLGALGPFAADRERLLKYLDLAMSRAGARSTRPSSSAEQHTNSQGNSRPLLTSEGKDAYERLQERISREGREKLERDWTERFGELRDKIYKEKLAKFKDETKDEKKAAEKAKQATEKELADQIHAAASIQRSMASLAAFFMAKDDPEGAKVFGAVAQLAITGAELAALASTLGAGAVGGPVGIAAAAVAAVTQCVISLLSGPDIDSLIYEQVIELRKEVRELHRDMLKQFAAVHERFNLLENRLNNRLAVLEVQNIVLQRSTEGLHEKMNRHHEEVRNWISDPVETKRFEMITKCVSGPSAKKELEWNEFKDCMIYFHACAVKEAAGPLEAGDATRLFEGPPLDSGKPLRTALEKLTHPKSTWRNMGTLAAVATRFGKEGWDDAVNPIPWAVCANAYLELSRRWPANFKRYGGTEQLEEIMAKGQKLKKALHGLAFNLDGGFDPELSKKASAQTAASALRGTLSLEIVADALKKMQAKEHGTPEAELKRATNEALRRLGYVATGTPDPGFLLALTKQYRSQVLKLDKLLEEKRKVYQDTHLAGYDMLLDGRQKPLHPLEFEKRRETNGKETPVLLPCDGGFAAKYGMPKLPDPPAESIGYWILPVYRILDDISIAGGGRHRLTYCYDIDHLWVRPLHEWRRTNSNYVNFSLAIHVNFDGKSCVSRSLRYPWPGGSGRYGVNDGQRIANDLSDYLIKQGGWDKMRDNATKYPPPDTGSRTVYADIGGPPIDPKKYEPPGIFKFMEVYGSLGGDPGEWSVDLLNYLNRVRRRDYEERVALEREGLKEVNSRFSLARAELEHTVQTEIRTALPNDEGIGDTLQEIAGARALLNAYLEIALPNDERHPELREAAHALMDDKAFQIAARHPLMKLYRSDVDRRRWWINNPTYYNFSQMPPDPEEFRASGQQRMYDYIKGKPDTTQLTAQESERRITHWRDEKRTPVKFPNFAPWVWFVQPKPPFPKPPSWSTLSEPDIKERLKLYRDNLTSPKYAADKITSVPEVDSLLQPPDPDPDPMARFIPDWMYERYYSHLPIALTAHADRKARLFEEALLKVLRNESGPLLSPETEGQPLVDGVLQSYERFKRGLEQRGTPTVVSPAAMTP